MNKSTILGTIIVFATLFSFGGFICTILGGCVRFWDIGVKELVALALYLLILKYAGNNIGRISFLIPFVCVAFPTPINHFFPGIYEQQGENGIIYPFINHVEIFFLYILINQKNPIKYKASAITIFLCIGILLSFLSNFLFCRSIQDIGILTTGLYTVRVLILINLIINNITIDNHKFIRGICYSIIFLLLESLLNTKIAGVSILTSGSLGNNTFGNVCGQLTCMLLFVFFFCDSFKKEKRTMIIGIIIGLFIVIASNTRMAILSFVLVFCFVLYPRLSLRNKMLLVLFLGIIIYFVWEEINLLLKESGKYNLEAILEVAQNGKDISWSSSTSSLLTRFDLWHTAINMIKHSPFMGIGFNMFDNLKTEYGFGINVVIDPHNGYFYLLSALGIIFGGTFIFLLYIRPWILYRKCPIQNIRVFCIFNMGMAICELTNAGVFKYQIFSFLVFLSVYSHKLYKEYIFTMATSLHKKY